MREFLLRFCFSLSLFALISCSDVSNGRPGGRSNDDGNGISSEPLEGTFGGKYWQALSGRATLQTFPNEADRYLVYIWGQEPTTGSDLCDAQTDPGEGLVFSVFAEIGDYELGPTQPLSFYKGNSSLVSLNGKIAVNGLDENGKLSLSIKAVYDAANIVNGQTQIIICK